MWGWVIAAGIVSWGIGAFMGGVSVARACNDLILDKCPGALDATARTIMSGGRGPARRTLRRSL